MALIDPQFSDASQNQDYGKYNLQFENTFNLRCNLDKPHRLVNTIEDFSFRINYRL